MEIILGADLEVLADRLFASWSDQAGAGREPLRPECLIVPNRCVQAWLRQRFVLDRRGRNPQRVRANWEVHFLNVFVNDWLYRMVAGSGGERAPGLHPCSRSGLTWRLYRRLGELGDEAVFEPLRAYLGDSTAGWRRYGLAAALAARFDDYQVYRPEMLLGWEKTKRRPGPEATPEAWQAELWRRLAGEKQDSYLAAFGAMRAKLPACGLENEYARIAVFGVPAIPPVYLEFFAHLPAAVNVRLFLPEPVGAGAGQQALDFALPAKAAPHSGRNRPTPAGLQGRPESPVAFRNPLAAALARQPAALVAEAIGRAADQVVRLPGREGSAAPATRLARLQADIRTDRPLVEDEPRLALPAGPADDSLRIHICHSPRREVEVLRDQLRRWFAEDPALEPRHIQVLVTDLAVYAPYIEAVFGTAQPYAAEAIPFAVADRFVLATSGAAQVFLKLLEFAAGRYRVSEVVDLLACDAVRERFGLATEEAGAVRELVELAGVRWGLDASQRERVSGAAFTAATSWRAGLDRLLLGQALGEVGAADRAGLVPGGALGDLAPAPTASAEDARRIGALCQLLDRLEWSGEILRPAEAFDLPEGSRRLEALLDAFFANTNETFAELLAIREELGGLAELARTTGLADVAVELEAVQAYLAGRLESAEAAMDVSANVVIFAGLRQGAAQPRRNLCLLGLGDAKFPRADARPAFDLLERGGARLNGDPSLRLADRAAFLEAVLAAREHLHLSYVGRSDQESVVIPPAAVVDELKSYLRARLALPERTPAWDGKTDLECFETLHHLQAFHPDYFTGRNERLFSCSEADLACARARLAPRVDLPERGFDPAALVEPESAVVQLDELRRFYDNPARQYFTEILKVRFASDEEAALADEEPFAADGLERYAVNHAIFLAMRAGAVAGDPLREALTQQGQLALGEPGRIEFAAAWEKVRLFLDSPITTDAFELPLRQLLSQPARFVDLAVPLGEVTLVGRVEVRDLPGGDALNLAARPAGLKAKDRLRAWLGHLALCAAGSLVKTVIAPWGSAELQEYGPLPAAEAADRLRELLGLRQAGRSRPVPFAPETSFAFIRHLSEVAEAGVGPEDKALNAAEEKWLGNRWERGESADAYFWRAFREPGPQARPEFADCACAVFAPMPRPAPAERKSPRGRSPKDSA